MTVYIVTANGKVSQEGYQSLADAQRFCSTRIDAPYRLTDYLYMSYHNQYKIIPVTIKEANNE